MCLLLFLCLVKPVFAQDSTNLYTKYRTDYLYQRDLYQKDYLDYLNKKDTYVQYGTVTAQNDKISATKNVLLSQNLMLKTYLIALRTTLPNSPNNQSELQKWEEWLSIQNQSISTLNSTSAIKNWSDEFKKQYVSIQTTLYTALIQSQIDRRLNTLADVKKLAESAKVDWSSDFFDKEVKIQQNFQLAIQSTQQNQRENEFSNFYPEAKKNLDQADIYLKSLVSDLKSTIIKNNN